MHFNIEDYDIFISKYDEINVEVEIKRKGQYIIGCFTINILNMSEKIKEIIKSNELSTFGYIRFDL